MPFQSDKQRRFLWANKPDVAKKFAEHMQHGGGVPGDSRAPKKITKKDRYGNSTTVEYAESEVPFNINSLLEKMLDRDIPETFQIPESSPIGGGVSFGFAPAHPGEPKGSDTVPAWLTPGEFVVNKEAMDDPENAAMVKAINDEGRMMQQGGVAYRREGGWGSEIFQEHAGDDGRFTDQGWGSFVEALRAEAARRNAQMQEVPPTEVPADLAVPTPTPEVAPKSIAEIAGVKKPRRRPTPQERWSADWNIPLGKALGADWSTSGHYTDKDIGRDDWKAGIKASWKFEEGGAVPVPISPTQALLEAREGFRPDVYLDSLKKPTVGHGHLLPAEYAGRVGEQPFSREQLDQFFSEDMAEAEAGAKRNAKKYGVKWDDLSRRERTALTSMAFQLGETGQGNFENMWTKLAAGDKEGAALEALDSNWAQQTPERAKDVYSAFQPNLGFNTGGPVGSGLRSMAELQTARQLGALTQKEYLEALKYVMPQRKAEGGPVYAYRGYDTAMQDAYDIEDPNADLSSSWVPPVYGMDEISPMEQAILSQENAASIPDLPPEDTGEAPAAPEVPWWEGITDWAFDTSVADERNASFNVKAAEANAEDAEETLAELQERIENGQPVNQHTLEAAEAAVEHQEDQVNEARAENLLFNTEIDAEGVVASESELMAQQALERENKPGPEDDKMALDQLAESPEFEDEDDPSKPSDKGQQHPSEVVQEGERMAQEEPAALDKAKGFFQDAFSDLFDGKELARMAIMYLGSRALGYSHGGSLNWAAKQYVGRLDAKQSSLAQNAKEFAKSGKYTPESVAAYQKSGDLSQLKPVGVSTQITGNTMTRTVNGQKVVFQEVKVGDNTLYQSPDGRTITAAAIESATQPYEASFEKGTPEYRQRRSRATGDAAGRFEEVWKAEDTIPGGRDKPATHFTKIRPKQAADEFWAWSEGMGLDPESDEALQIMTQAYRQAISDGKTGDVKPTSLKPYLEQQYIREKSGAPELFITNPGAKPGEDIKYVRGDKMASLDRNVEAVTSQLPGLQGLSSKDAKDRFYQLAIEEWGSLDSETQEQYGRSATKDESGFYVFLNKRAADLLTKAGG